MQVQHLNPDGLPHNPAFSQAISVSGPHKTVYVGGQNAVDAAGNIVGSGDIGVQSKQTYANLRLALQAAGADLEDVVKWTIYVVEGQPIEPGLAAFQEAWGTRQNPPSISVIFVASLGNPEFLVEIDAIAVVPE